jgi:uncharacterized membrane protein YqhA
MEQQPWYNGFLSRLFGMKYLAFLVSLLLLIIGVLVIVLSINTMVRAVAEFLEKENGHPGAHLIEAVDTLLFSMVILILSGGIYKLFVGDKDTFKHISILSKLKSFKDLKILLWETILLTLTVWAALNFFLDEIYTYEQLILPASILLLAVALRVMTGGKMTTISEEE